MYLCGGEHLEAMYYMLGAVRRNGPSSTVKSSMASIARLFLASSMPWPSEPHQNKPPGVATESEIKTTKTWANPAAAAALVGLQARNNRLRGTWHA